MPEKTCTLCPELVKSRRKICWGELLETEHCLFSAYPRVMAIAEAPGQEEDKLGRTLIGSSGQEARQALMVNGILTYGIWLDNIVKCRPTDNRDPRAEEIENCTNRHLLETVRTKKPEYIIAMGRFSTRFFLGDVDMELVHGIPRTIQMFDRPLVIIPTYHPAAGLHSPEQMILFNADMKTAGMVVKREIPATPPEDNFRGLEEYTRKAEVVPNQEGLIAIDTEWAEEEPWCVSFSTAPGTSHVAMADEKGSLERLNQHTQDPSVITIIHNALYDLPVLAQMGIHPGTVADTMVMAYLLQAEPQGLKPLSYRHCGMEMSSYTEMVGPETECRALQYLLFISEHEWPKPKPELEWRKGEPHVRQPQNIKRKVQRLLNTNAPDLFRKYKAMDGTDVVTDVLGPLKEAGLSDIPMEDAVRYSARDADATLRVYPILWEKIQAMGLEGTFWRDMRMLPMVVDMMANGLPINREAFRSLGEYFQERLDEIQSRMQRAVGHLLDGAAVNPASYPQMSELIYDKLELHKEGGRLKSRKGAKNKSTANDILSRYVTLHPVVPDIIEWREYQKLKTTYSDVIPRLAGEDGRIRTTIRVTRTSTGRLSSSSPNLLAQPTRSEEGRKVRDCYETREGNVFVSGDYSQVEMRVAADNAGDEKMLRIFWEGLDIHTQTASEMFGVPVADVDEKKHRYPAKRVGFGILYLITADGLHRVLAESGVTMSVDDCKQMIESWFRIYSGISDFMKASGAHAKRYGYVKDMWGRLRYIPGIRSTNKWVRLEAERQAGNAPIQMGAQGVIKEAMGRLVPVYRGHEIKPLLQIHDDLLWEMEEWKAPIVIPKVKRVMEGVAPDDFVVPLKVDFKTGRKWGSMKEWKEED